MKKCSHCAKEIQNDAIKCRYCGKWLTKKPMREIDRYLLGGMGLALLLSLSALIQGNQDNLSMLFSAPHLFGVFIEVVIQGSIMGGVAYLIFGRKKRKITDKEEAQ